MICYLDCGNLSTVIGPLPHPLTRLTHEKEEREGEGATGPYRLIGWQSRDRERVGCPWVGPMAMGIRVEFLSRRNTHDGTVSTTTHVSFPLFHSLTFCPSPSTTLANHRSTVRLVGAGWETTRSESRACQPITPLDSPLVCTRLSFSTSGCYLHDSTD